MQEVHPVSHCEGREMLSGGFLKDLISKIVLLGKRKRECWGRDEAKWVTLTLEDSRGVNLIKALSVEHPNTASNPSVKWKLKMWVVFFKESCCFLLVLNQCLRLIWAVRLRKRYTCYWHEEGYTLKYNARCTCMTKKVLTWFEMARKKLAWC